MTKEQRNPYNEALKERIARLRQLDEQKREETVRQAKLAVDYDVFMAEVEHAGITSTGLTGDDVPNELPAVLDAYRKWVSEPSVQAEAGG